MFRTWVFLIAGALCCMLLPIHEEISAKERPTFLFREDEALSDTGEIFDGIEKSNEIDNDAFLQAPLTRLDYVLIKLEEELKWGFAQSDADVIIRLERMEGQIAEDRSASWVPLLMVSLLLLTPIALFMLWRSLMQRLEGQVDELKRQRLRLESVDESLRELPGKLPKLALDTSQLADRLRDELRQPTPAPVAPAPVVTPFYQNAQII